MRAGTFVENANLGLRSAVVFTLFHYKVLAGEGRYLRQVCDAEDLLTSTEGLEFLTDCFSRSAANSNVDFVEDKRAGRRRLRLRLS